MTERIYQANIQHDADILYDLTEGLAQAVEKLGAKAIDQVLLERLQDAAIVLDDTIKEVQSQMVSSTHEQSAPPADLAAGTPEITARVDTPLDEPIDLESDEARDIVRRYFATRLGDPMAWDNIGEHLAKNSVTIPPRRKLNNVIKSWMPDIEQDIADIHGIQIRWINFNGNWVAAEVTRQPTRITSVEQGAQKTKIPKPSATTPPAPIPAVPIPRATPEKLPVKQEYVPTIPLEIICAKIIDLPPRNKRYTRFNTLRNKLSPIETDAEQLLNHLCEIGALTTFRFGGGRQITADHALAHDLDTKPIKQGKKREQGSGEEAPFTDYVSAAMITDAFLQPRMHIEQAMTYRDIMSVTSYDERTVKEAVKFLKCLDVLKTDVRPRSRSGHRSASQQVQKVMMASQTLKDQLKSLGGLSSLTDHIGLLAATAGEQTDDGIAS